MVAYAQVLQFWAEKADLPTLAQPCLLAGSILELREAMKCYISFSDNTIFSTVALPEEPLASQLEKTIPESTQPVYPDPLVEEAAVKVTGEEAAPTVGPTEGSCTFWTLDEEPTRREQSPHQFPGWKEM